MAGSWTSSRGSCSRASGGHRASGAEWGLAVFSVGFLIYLLRALYESFELVFLAARTAGG